MNEEAVGLCPTCINSIHCDTWAEWKCKVKERRIYDYKAIKKCESYKKRDKNFKEPKCQCEDCLKNESLFEYEEED